MLILIIVVLIIYILFTTDEYNTYEYPYYGGNPPNIYIYPIDEPSKNIIENAEWMNRIKKSIAKDKGLMANRPVNVITSINQPSDTDIVVLVRYVTKNDDEKTIYDSIYTDKLNKYKDKDNYVVLLFNDEETMFNIVSSIDIINTSYNIYSFNANNINDVVYRNYVKIGMNPCIPISIDGENALILNKYKPHFDKVNKDMAEYVNEDTLREITSIINSTYKDTHTIQFILNPDMQIENYTCISISVISDILHLLKTTNKDHLKKYVSMCVYKCLLTILYFNTMKYNSFYLYGAGRISFIEYIKPNNSSSEQCTNVKYYIFGEEHNANGLNIPTYSIYIYDLFEKLIELNILQKRHVHIFLESSVTKYTNRVEIKKHYPINSFMSNATNVYYYLNICQRYLDLDPKSLYNKKKFTKLLTKYNLDNSIISNFINLKEGITFHYIDNRVIFDEIKSILNTDIPKLFEKNVLIFPENVLDKNNKDAYKRLSVLMDNNKDITVYRELYEELNNSNYFNDISGLINKYTKNTGLHQSYIMDQVTLLKFMYLEYKRNGNKETVLFHGGNFHADVYHTAIIGINPNKPHTIEVMGSIDKYIQGKALNIINITDEVPDIKQIIYEKSKLNRYIHLSTHNSFLYNMSINNNLRLKPSEIDYQYIASCKSKIVDNRFKIIETKEDDLTGGQEYASLQQIQIFAPPQRQLDALEQVELAELRLFFKDIDVIQSAEELLEASTFDTNTNTVQIDLTGGKWKNNPWVQFLL